MPCLILKEPSGPEIQPFNNGDGMIYPARLIYANVACPILRLLRLCRHD